MEGNNYLTTGFIVCYSQEEPPQLVRSILTLIVSVDILVDLISISKTERTPNLEVVSTPRREDIHGPPRLSEDTELVPVE